MDKRTVIGFIVIMAILLLWFPLWNMFFPPPKQISSPPPESTAVSPQAPAAAPESSKVIPQAVAIAPIDSAAITASQLQPEKIVTIETQNLRVMLSSRGGNVKQIILKNYKRYDGSEVALFGDYPEPEWARHGALTLGYNDQIAPFNSYDFRFDAPDTILNEKDSMATVTFSYASSGGSTVTKVYKFHFKDYLFDLDIGIQKPADLGLASGVTVGMFAPREPTESDFNQDKGKLGGFYSIGGALDYFNSLKSGQRHETVTGPIDWAALRTKYFATVLMADKNPGKDVIVLGGQTNILDPARNTYRWDEYGVGLTYDQPGQETALSFRVFAGPLDYDRLRSLGSGMTGLIDFGWKFFRPFAIAILWVFTSLHKIIFNYGAVIIVFSIIMKVIFWPLSLKSAKSMYKMREIQPRLQEIKEKFKNDPAKLNQETMKAYKEFGVNPFGSCLPMLIQLPIFWALYSVLSNTIELRGADFVFWITDLSQPDPSGKHIPLQIGILPIIMGVAMFFQQKMTITDPKQKMMVYLMPALFTYLFSRWASGLVLYWTVFSVMGIVEQWFVMRHIKAEKESKRV